jgi:hypothetical protein
MALRLFALGIALAACAGSAGADSKNIRISPPPSPIALPTFPAPFPEFRYSCANGATGTCDLGDYMTRMRICAIAVVKNGTLRLERYNADNTMCRRDEEESPASWPCRDRANEIQSNCAARRYGLASVTKSVTSTLFGMALIEHAARQGTSWRENLGMKVADILPALRAPPSRGAYDGVTLLDVIQMRSGNGVGRADRLDDAFYEEVVEAGGGDRRILRFAAAVSPQSHWRGAFAYLNLDTAVLGAAADRMGSMRLSARLKRQICIASAPKPTPRSGSIPTTPWPARAA